MEPLKTLNMCDFCSKEIQTCGSKTVPAKETGIDQGDFDNPDAVIACNGYENPVDVLKKKFH